MQDRTQRTILESLDRLRLRWMQVRSVSLGLQVLFYLLLAGAALLLAFPQLPALKLVLGLGVAAAGLGAAWAWIHRPDAAALAKDYDDSAGLKDRLSSSVELMAGEERTPMVDALLEDAAVATTKVQPAQVYGFALPREGRWLPVPAMMMLGVLFLNGSMGANPKVDPALESSLQAGIETIDELLSPQDSQELTKREKELMDQLKELKAKLSERGVEKKDAMAEVSKLLDQLEREEQAAQEKERKLKELLAGLKEENKELSEEMQQGDWQDALNKLKEKMKELEEELAKKKKEGASKEELEKLEEQLAKLREIEAQYMKLLQMNMDLDMLGHTIDFLKAFEGDLADLENMTKPDFLKPCDCDDPGT